MDAELAAAVSALPPGLDLSNIPETRKTVSHMVPLLQKLQEPSLLPQSEYHVEDHVVSVEGGEIRMRVLIPATKGAEPKKFPLFFWMHGGGWAIGNIDMDDYYLRPFCVSNQIVITSIEYRQAPENLFPTGVNDCLAALKWTVENASKLSIDLYKGFIVGGSSAGGNLSAVLSLLARDDPFFQQDGRRLTGQCLMIPAVVHPEAVPGKYKSELLSMEQNKDGPVLRRQDMLDAYKNLKAQPESPLLSPLLASSHAALPPAFIQVSGLDPLRDEGLLYEKVLTEAGVKTKLEVYPGLPHGGHFMMPTLPVSKKFNKDLSDGLCWLLSSS